MLTDHELVVARDSKGSQNMHAYVYEMNILVDLRYFNCYK